jgi:hypothetical protein
MSAACFWNKTEANRPPSRIYKEWITNKQAASVEMHHAQQHSKRPPINCLGVAALPKDLRSQVLCCADKRVHKLVVVHALLAEPKVCKTQVSVGTEQHVFGFQIPVHRIRHARGSARKKARACR